MEVTSQTIGTGDSARQAEPKIVFFVFFIDFRVFKTRKQVKSNVYRGSKEEKIAHLKLFCSLS